MTLHRDTKINLIEGINEETQVPLSIDGLIFSRYELVDENDPLRLRMRITAKDDYQYRGTEVITFRRLNLADLDYLLLQPPRFDPRSSLYNLLPQIKTVLGIHLTEEDVEDALVFEDQGGFSVNVVAKPSSFGWYGETTLRFLELPPITIPISETTIRW